MFVDEEVSSNRFVMVGGLIKADNSFVRYIDDRLILRTKVKIIGISGCESYVIMEY